MRATVVVDNTVYARDFKAEHGYALFLEVGDRRILFDTGASDILIHNLDKLGIDPDSIDMCIISHGHYDHTGGLLPLLSKRSAPLNICATSGIFKERYSSRGDTFVFGGVPFTQKEVEEAGGKFVFIDEPTRIDGISFMPSASLSEKGVSTDDGLVVKSDDGYKTDIFEDELSIAFEGSEGTVVVAGCAHCGFIEIVGGMSEQFAFNRVSACFGGAHLTHADEGYIRTFAQKLKSSSWKDFYLSHCTGFTGTLVLADTLKERYHHATVGRSFDL